MNNKNEGKESIRKHDRVLEIYTRLLAGEVVRKQELAEEYCVAPRSIQRDIDSIRDFYSNRGTKGSEFTEIRYNRILNGFQIVNARTTTLTNAELFSVAKIILESRSLSKDEAEQIISKLIDSCLPAAEQKKLSNLLSNEIFHYVEPRHQKKLVDTLWALGEAVYHHKMIHLEYQKSNGESTTAFIKPVGIMESEYYFYLIAYIGDKDKKYPGFPTIYRIDRITQYRIMEETFYVPYHNRFEEGEFRKRIPFMYGGPLTKVKFIYNGPDVNAVLDKLPASSWTRLDNNRYQIQTEVYGSKGIEMWLGSQKEFIEKEDPDDNPTCTDDCGIKRSQRTSHR